MRRYGATNEEEIPMENDVEHKADELVFWRFTF
jgi:hypothetical protein